MMPTEAFPFPVEANEKTDLCLHKEVDGKLVKQTVAKDVSPKILELVKRGSMFPDLLAAVTAAAKALASVVDGQGVVDPEDVICCTMAYNVLLTTLDIVYARGLASREEETHGDTC